MSPLISLIRTAEQPLSNESVAMLASAYTLAEQVANNLTFLGVGIYQFTLLFIDSRSPADAVAALSVVMAAQTSPEYSEIQGILNAMDAMLTRLASRMPLA